jgi:endoglucanase
MSIGVASALALTVGMGNGQTPSTPATQGSAAGQPRSTSPVLSLGSGAAPVKAHGQLSVKGAQLTDEHGKPVALNGVSYGWHCWWPRFWNKGCVSWLASDWKCSVLRAALGVEVKGSGYIDSPDKSKQQLEAVIDAAIANNIYVIIDWHSHSIKLAEAKAFFAEMAKKYGKNPHIIYELFNEPVKDTWPAVKEYSIELIKTIRAIDPNNVILVGNPQWDQKIKEVADSPITGYTNIMYVCHFYAASHGKWLRDECDYALQKGVGIFITESAATEASGNGKINLPEWQAWVDWCATNKVSLVTWSISDKDETCSMLKPSAAGDGNWKDSDLKETGIKTREMLRKRAEGGK